MPGYRDHLTYEHLHSGCSVYPTLGAGGAGWIAGAPLATAAAAGTFGALVDLIPVATILLPFDIHYINIEVLGANAVYELVLGRDAAATEIARVRFTRVAAQEAANGVPIITKIMPANTRIQAMVACSVAGPINIEITALYHTY